MATKVTYTLDDETVRRIRTLAERSRKSQSLVVREAVAEYAAKEDMLSPEEQARLLRVIDSLGSQPSTKTAKDVDRELRELRAARRSRGRLHPVD